MKTKIAAIFFSILFCLCLTACKEVKRPVDYPNSTWICDIADISFTVSKDGKIENATMLAKNGETIPISLVFANISDGKVSITNVDETETYLSGSCTYDIDSFSIFVTDIYNPDMVITSTRLPFKRA